MTKGTRGVTLEQSLESRLTRFHACPRCESPNLISTQGDLFCVYCDWNSIAETTLSRGMPRLFIRQEEAQR